MGFIFKLLSVTEVKGDFTEQPTLSLCGTVVITVHAWMETVY